MTIEKAVKLYNNVQEELEELEKLDAVLEMAYTHSFGRSGMNIYLKRDECAMIMALIAMATKMNKDKLQQEFKVDA